MNAKMKHAVVMLGLVTLLAAAARGASNEIGYVEDFALAEDRAKALEQLIPGTEAYYYYHCLHAQNQDKLAEADKILVAWIKKHDRTPLVRQMEYRQALLKYDKDPKGSLEYLRRNMDLHFNHQREQLNRKPNFPIALKQDLISRKTLTARAYRRHGSNNTGGFEGRALDWLIATSLNPDSRRHLLSRLRRPDHPNLPQLVVDDLNHKHSGGFGSHTIHRLLLQDQLDDLLTRKADLINNSHFINAYLVKLQPGVEEDWRRDSKVHQALLDRQWAFVSRLAPAFNSLKAHVLHHRLAFDRSQGIYDKQRFLDYIKLPRPVSYIEPHYLDRAENRRHRVNLGADYQAQTLWAPVHNDEPLVRSYLEHFFVEAKTWKDYETFIRDTYLKEIFATTKVLHGVGDQEQWYAMLSPVRLQQLKERIELAFVPTNKQYFEVVDDVALQLDVKNVKKLIVKVFRINTLNYYLTHGRDVNTDINLDGLVANKEDTYTYSEPSLRRVRRIYTFSDLDERGVYVIEFIGNGKSSRALVRKGRLQFLVDDTSAGHVFTVLDEKNRKRPKAELYLGGHHYTADKAGEIAAPFSNRPARLSIILVDGDFASLDHFTHHNEAYRLTAGFYVDREQLLNRRDMQLVVRASLSVNGEPAPLGLLGNTRLVITSVDRDGVSSTKTIPGVKLKGNADSVFEFQTPDRLATIHFALHGRVKSLTGGKKIDLAADTQYAVNAVDKTEKVESLHLMRTAGGYFIDMLGKTGEPKVDRPVNLIVKHRDFKDQVHVVLKTDHNGRVTLGALNDIDWINATGPDGVTYTWPLDGQRRDRYSYPSAVHGVAGAPVRLPYLGSATKSGPREFSLLEVKAGAFVTDRIDAMKISNGFIVIDNLPAGDYNLLLKDLDTQVAVRLTEGVVREGYVLGKLRHLQAPAVERMHITRVDQDSEQVSIHLANVNPFTRVNVIATRYVPRFYAYGHLGKVNYESSRFQTVPFATSLYFAGRDIGDEYRYILERKYTPRYPGNMLERPELLLNPWAIRETQTTHQQPQTGTHFGRGTDDAASESENSGGRGVAAGANQDFANLDFLANPAVVLANLVPDKNGVIEIDRKIFGDRHHLHIVAADDRNTVYRDMPLVEGKERLIDLRLGRGLDPSQHFTEQKQISVVKKGDPFILSDITTSQFETYDTLSKVYGLFTALNPDANLAEFRFILDWPNLDDKVKYEKYSRYACHELSFFVYRKDRAFFNAVIKPHLVNKKDKTFMDDYLLGHDLSAYLESWRFGRLNMVERALLGQRISAQHTSMARHVKDRYDLLPPDIDRYNFLFRTALKGGALEAGGGGAALFSEFGLHGLDGDESAPDALATLAVNGDFRKGRSRGAVVGGALGAAHGPRSARESDGVAPREQTMGPAKPATAPVDMMMMKMENKKDSLERAAELRLQDRASGYLKQSQGKKRVRADARANELGEKVLEQELGRRATARQFYRKLEATREWVENNYYKLPIAAQNEGLVPVNAFWRDFAANKGQTPFQSSNLAWTTHTFTEMMMALAVLDLPYEAGEHKSKLTDNRLSIDPASPMVIYHKQIKQARINVADIETPVLISQNFFRHNDRYRHVNNERYDKFVTEEFLTAVVYGCQVVATNPTSARRKLDILLQVPQGAIPVLNGRYTHSAHVDLQPYNTTTLEYYFYFPHSGKWRHYPVHVASHEALIAFVEPFVFNVVDELTRIDTESWDYISQHGDEQQVVDYLKKYNLGRINLDRIAWRVQDEKFFAKTMGLLDARHVYDHTLWSYGVKHNHLPAIHQFLKHADGFLNQCGPYIDCKLVTIDPVERNQYEHMEYKPLVSARAHTLGKRRRILNDRFFEQYHRLMTILAYRPQFNDDDRMAVAYYMLLQDRIDEALAFFKQVNRSGLKTQLQYDYANAYLGFYTGDLSIARTVTSQYADHPVDRWRKRFANMKSQLDEIEGKSTKVADEENREQVQQKLAATEASFDFEVEAKKVTLNYQNVKKISVNYYLMDIELLFSRQPFVKQYSDQFSYIRPNETEMVELPEGKTTYDFQLPRKLQNQNVMVEVTANGRTKAQPYFSNALSVQLIENYGQVRVAHRDNDKPYPKVYVKVYARMNGGQVRFYKDGYTDLRGRFDYTSLNTNELNQVQQFSILVLSDEHGAVVREAMPPKR